MEEGLNIDKVKPDEYEALSNDMWSEDFSACFDNSEDFKKDALGYMVYKGTEAVSGCMGRVYSDDFMELVLLPILNTGEGILLLQRHPMFHLILKTIR